MKIAMFTDAYYPRTNGVTISVDTYSKALAKLGHTVCIVCPEYTDTQQRCAFFDEEESDKNSSCKIIRVPSMFLPWSKEDRLVRVDKWHFVKKRMKAFAPDIIHINSEWVVGYYGAMYARKKHIPFVFTFHTLWEEYLKNYTSVVPDYITRAIGRNSVKFYLKRATEIIVPTKRIEAVVRKYGIEKPVDYLSTGVPKSILDFNESRAKQVYTTLYKKFPNIKGKKVLLFVGRIAIEKNLEFLFEVFFNVLKKQSDVVLLFVGGGPYMEDLKDIAQEKGINDKVFFTGYMNREDLIYFYKLSSIFVFPSKTDTQGLVTVEAMLSGLPVVAIGAMGTLDVMNGNNGGFMTRDSVEEFSARVLDLLENKDLYNKKAQEAKNWGKKWLLDELTPKLVSYYQKAIANYKTQQQQKLQSNKNKLGIN